MVRVENTVSNSTSIVARRFVAEGMCLQSCCLEMALVHLPYLAVVAQYRLALQATVFNSDNVSKFDYIHVLRRLDVFILRLDQCYENRIRTDSGNGLYFTYLSDNDE
jgi:hypothetical protein